MKRFTGILAAAGLALAVSANGSFACDAHKAATATAEAKSVKAVPAADTKPAEKGCCAKKAAEAKNAVAQGTGSPTAIAAAESKGCDKPCDGAKAADGAGCPKKAAPTAAVVAQAQPEPAKDVAPADPGKDH